jgi:predicted alpha/beta-hydrolase family hydrolase
MLVYPRRGGPPSASLILAHGAGAGQRSPFVTDLASGVAARGLDVITFNFPYAEQNRRIPDRQEVLGACYRAVAAAARLAVPSARIALFIGGKSMGGRIATHVAAADPALQIRGLVLLGYPLHPPGRPERRRDAHLPHVRRPTLIIQGSRDAFGTPEELAPVCLGMSPAPTLHVVAGGDHSFKVSAMSKAGWQTVLENVQQTIVQWIATINREDAAR